MAKLSYRYVYSLLHCREKEEVLIFKKSETCNWGEQRRIQKGFNADINAFYLHEEVEMDATNTIYLGTGYANRNPGLWVIPGGGCERGKGSSYALEELRQETGVDLRHHPNLDFEEFADPSGLYCILIVHMAPDAYESVQAQAAASFIACNANRKKYLQSIVTERSLDEVKELVTQENLPPLVSDELCAVRSISTTDAQQLFKEQGTDTDWFLAAVRYMQKLPQEREEQPSRRDGVGSDSVLADRSTYNITSSSSESHSGRCKRPLPSSDSSSYEDRRLQCIECRRSFNYSAERQKAIKERGHATPKRCYDCRTNK